MTSKAKLLPLLGLALAACSQSPPPSQVVLDTRAAPPAAATVIVPSTAPPVAVVPAPQAAVIPSPQVNLPSGNETAPIALHEAEQNLQRAMQAQRQGNNALAEHYTYLARRQLEIARARGDQRAALDRRLELDRELDAMRLRGAMPPVR